MTPLERAARVARVARELAEHSLKALRASGDGTALRLDAARWLVAVAMSAERVAMANRDAERAAHMAGLDRLAGS